MADNNPPPLNTFNNEHGRESLQAFLERWRSPNPQDLGPLFDAWNKVVARVYEQPCAGAEAQLAHPQPARLLKTGRNEDYDYIPGTLNPQREVMLSAYFLTRTVSNGSAAVSNGSAEVQKVLVSPDYNASYIFADTLAALGHVPIIAAVRPSRNPRGGEFFRPIGFATLHMSLNPIAEGQFLFDDPFYINLLVLPGSPGKAGVEVIVGRNVLGGNWMPQRQQEYGFQY